MSNDDWTWEASPKVGFQRRKLEKIYQMPSYGESVKVSQTTLNTPAQVPEKYRREVLQMPKERVIRTTQNRRSSQRYWTEGRVYRVGFFLVFVRSFARWTQKHVIGPLMLPFIFMFWIIVGSVVLGGLSNFTEPSEGGKVEELRGS